MITKIGRVSAKFTDALKKINCNQVDEKFGPASYLNKAEL